MKLVKLLLIDGTPVGIIELPDGNPSNYPPEYIRLHVGGAERTFEHIGEIYLEIFIADASRWTLVTDIPVTL